MAKWKEQCEQLQKLLRLRTNPVAYKRFETIEEFEKVPNVQRLKNVNTFCQIMWFARAKDLAMGATKQDARDNVLLDREDVTRMLLVNDLKTNFGVNDEAIPIILHLIDQIHSLQAQVKQFIEKQGKKRSTFNAN